MEKLTLITLIAITISLWFWALADISKSRIKNPRKNTVWLFIILAFPMLGSFAYLRVRNKLANTEPRAFNPKFN